MNSDTTDTPFHLYSTLHTSLSCAEVAELYRSNGWEYAKMYLDRLRDTITVG